MRCSRLFNVESLTFICHEYRLVKTITGSSTALAFSKPDPTPLCYGAYWLVIPSNCEDTHMYDCFVFHIT